jgi:hypothetical protein
MHKSTPTIPRFILRRLLILAGGPVVLIGCIVGLSMIGGRLIPSPDTNPAHYGSALKEWNRSGLVALFPPSIPADAKGIHFSVFPGYLQGRPWIQLRMQLPPDQVATIEAIASAATDHIYAPDFRFTLPGKKDDWPIPGYQTGDRPDEFQFPPTFKLYVIKAVDHGLGSWDPYESYGVAVSRQTNEVVYWANQ